MLHTAGFAVPHELPDSSGVAHVAEHLIAHGPQLTRQRYVLPALVDSSQLSSFTGLTFRGLTCYVASGERDAVERFSEVILAALAAPVSDGPSIGVERGRWMDRQWRPGTIEDEIRLRDNAYRRAVSTATAVLCFDDALRYDPAGQRDGLQKLTDDEVARFQARWFTAQRISEIRIRADKPEPLAQHLGSAWSWTPVTRHEVITEPSSTGTKWTFGWRVGLFPAHLREHNVVAARFLAGLLRASEVRRALADAGAQVEFGPIVDSTLPDPVVVLLVRQHERIVVVDEVAAVLQHAALAVAGRSDARGSVEPHVSRVEPLVEDEWGSVVIARLIASLAGERVEKVDVDDVVIAVRSLLTTSYQDVKPAGAGDRFSVLDPNPDNRERAKAPDHVVPQRIEPATSTAHGSPSVPKMLFLSNNTPWPGRRIGMSIRFHPARASSRWDAVVDLAALWNRGPLRASGRVVPAGSRAARCVEWRITPKTKESLLADLQQQDFGVRPVMRKPGAVRCLPPPHSIIAAALAGAPVARAELELSGFATPPETRPETSLWAESVDDVFSIAVTGADAEAEAALRFAGLEIVDRLQIWLESMSVEQSSPRLAELAVEQSSPDSWSVRSDNTGAGLSEAHAVVDLTRLDLPFSTVIGRVRQVVRDAGFYAFSGRVEPGWGVGVLSVVRHQATPVDGTLLRTAMRGLLSDRTQEPDALFSARRTTTTPAEALASLQNQALDGLSLRLPTISSELPVRLNRPVTYLYTSHQRGSDT